MLHSRLQIIYGILMFTAALITFKLFYLQVWQGSIYQKMADEQHTSGITVPARRGEIMVQNIQTGKYYPLATNYTLDMIYLDPKLIIERGDPELVVSELAPLLFDLFEERKNEKKEDDEYLASFLLEQKQKDSGTGSLTASGSVMIVEESREKTPEEKMIDFRDYLREKIYSRKTRRYVPIINKIPREIAETIEALDLTGVVLSPEHWRFYPEGELASGVLGYTDRQGRGVYGIEGSLDTELQGKAGRIYTAVSSRGKEINYGDRRITPVENGSTIYLTIDRRIQKKVEEILARKLAEYDADSIEVVIADPITGKILAMANYPSFDPNQYYKAFERVYLKADEAPRLEYKWQDNNRGFPIETEITRSADEIVITGSGSQIKISSGSKLLPEEYHQEDIKQYIYKNLWGPRVFRNRIIEDAYEPGSILKAVVMAAAIDAGEVDSDTTFFDEGPVYIDNYKITTWNNKYHGKESMTEVLQNSCNTGMVWVSEKMERKMLWKYLKSFGFGQKTGLNIAGENSGKMNIWRYWSDIERANVAFGQGLSVTPIQMLTAFSALVNGGKLMQPILIEKIKDHQGQETINEPRIVRQVISPDTSETISAMLVSVVDVGSGRGGRVPGYFVGGKTGTAQIAQSNGRGYETGTGSTISSFVGFGPIEDPRFTMLVKVDRPRKKVYGSETAAPIFREIATWLLESYFAVEKSR